MIRFLQLLRLKFRAYVLQAQAEHYEATSADHAMRYEITLMELRKVKGRIATLERPETLLTQALRRAGK